MKIEIQNYADLKAIAILKRMNLTTELPNALGFKSSWGLKMALKNPNTKDEVLKRAKEIFFE